MKNKKVIIVYNTSHYAFLSRVNLIKKLQLEGFTVFLIAPYDAYSEKLVKLGVVFIPIIMDNKGSNPIYDFKYLIRLILIYRRVSPDVLLQFTIKPNIYGSLAARLLNLKTINTITGLGTAFLYEGWLNKISKLLYGIAFKKADFVFFQNMHDKDVFIKENLIKEERSLIIPGSGIDTKKFYPVDFKRESTNFNLLFVGRVIRDKGIYEFIEAARLIKNKYKNVSFQIIGGVGVKNRGTVSMDQITLWQNEGIIEYGGETSDIKKFLSKADCVVLPSYREGTSKSLLEAASMAIPIVTTDVPGCNNIVKHGENGFLCIPKNGKDLADKIENMINLSNEVRSKMGMSGRQKMIDEFEEEKVIKIYLDTINSIL